MFVGTSGTETTKCLLEQVGLRLQSVCWNKWECLLDWDYKVFVGTSGTETTKCLLEQVGLRLQSVCWNKWD